MESFFSTLNDEQRIIFARSYFSSLSLDCLIHIRNTVIDGLIMIKGGKPKMVPLMPQVVQPVAPPKRIYQKIRLYNVPVNSDDYNDMRQEIIAVLGDAVSTKIFANPEKQEAAITFDSYETADLAYERLAKVYKNVQMVDHNN
jgi:hypothetical protein